MTDVARLPLLVTSCEPLLDEVLKVAAATGVETRVADSASASVPMWTLAPLVLVGEDLLPALVARALTRRPGVIVLRHGGLRERPPAEALWRHAVALGAEEVLDLAESPTRLIERLGDLADSASAGGPVVAVTGGCGGAGSSTLACALALEAEDCLLIDADALSGGIDLRMAAEDIGGLRWPGLAGTRGRVPVTALREALPQVRSARVLSMSREVTSAPTPAAMSAVLDAGQRGFGLTIVDCPRSVADDVRLAWSRCTVALVVVPLEVASVVAASAVADAMRTCAADVRLVVRARRDATLTPDDVAQALDLPLATVLPVDRALARGEPVVYASGPMVRSARTLLDGLGARPAANRRRRREGRSPTIGSVDTGLAS